MHDGDILKDLTHRSSFINVHVIYTVDVINLFLKLIIYTCTTYTILFYGMFSWPLVAMHNIKYLKDVYTLL